MSAESHADFCQSVLPHSALDCTAGWSGPIPAHNGGREEGYLHKVGFFSDRTMTTTKCDLTKLTSVSFPLYFHYETLVLLCS